MSERRLRCCGWDEFVERCRKEPLLSRADEGVLTAAAAYLHDEGELLLVPPNEAAPNHAAAHQTL
eukprot:4550288-Prymnesium_polylepis.1